MASRNQAINLSTNRCPPSCQLIHSTQETSWKATGLNVNFSSWNNKERQSLLGEGVFHFQDDFCLLKLIKSPISTSKRATEWGARELWGGKATQSRRTAPFRADTLKISSSHCSYARKQPHGDLQSWEELCDGNCLTLLSPCWPPIKSKCPLTSTLPC